MAYQTTSDFYIQLCTSVASFAQELSIQLVTNITTSGTANISQIQEITFQFIEAQPDAVVLCVISCNDWLTTFKAMNYIPKTLLSPNCVEFVDTPELIDDARYVVGPSQWYPGLKGTEYLETLSMSYSMFPTTDPTQTLQPYVNPLSPSLQIVEVWSIRFPNTSTAYTHVDRVAAYEFLTAALYSTGANDVFNGPLLNKQLQVFYGTSFYGIISTNQYGYNQQKQMVLLQRDINATIKIISPLSSAQSTFIYPMPTWSERVYIHVMYATPQEQALIAIMAVAYF